MRASALLLVILVADAEAVSVSVQQELLRPAPLLGFGGELVFQDVTDKRLNELIRGSSAVQRYPGGTPSDYWDWQQGCEAGSHPPDPPCHFPARPQEWSSYVDQIGSPATVFDLNQLHSSLTYQIEGLKAFQAQGVDVKFLEIGNEMYDSSRPDVMAAYPAPSDYAKKAANWSRALKDAFPGAQVAAIGARAQKDDPRLTEWNAQVFAVENDWDAATLHIYAGISQVSSVDKLGPFFSAAFKRYQDNARNAESEIPGRLRLWITELGTYGAQELDFSYIHALFKVLLTALLTQIPRVDMVLPYCLVCGDQTAPAFLQNASQDVWSITSSGILHSLLFRALRSKAIAPLSFNPNPPLVPSFRGASLPLQATCLFGLAGYDEAKSHAQTLVIFNLCANAERFDLTSVFSTSDVLEAHTAAPPLGNSSMMFVPYASTVQTSQVVNSSILMPPFSLSSLILVHGDWKRRNGQPAVFV